MSKRTHADQIEVAATPGAVFRMYSDVENWSRWDHTIQYSHVDKFESGGRGVLKSKNGPKSKMEVLEVVDGVSFTTRFRLPMCTLQLKYEIRSTGVSKTLVTHSVVLDGTLASVFWRLLGREIRRELPVGLCRLKSITEAEAVEA